MNELDKIRLTIKAKGFTQTEFAKKIGVSHRTLVNYLNGNSKLDLDTLKKIASVLGVPVSYFFEEGIGKQEIIQNNHNSIIKSKVELKNIELEKENERLRAELRGCRELLKSKDELIQVLKEQVKRQG